MKKITGYVKLQLPAGKANPSPPVGPALGQHGVNIMAFCKDFNARTAQQGDMIIPVVITVFSDRSFTFILKTPPERTQQDQGREGEHEAASRACSAQDARHEYHQPRVRDAQHGRNGALDGHRDY
jgi:hypothetical protein